MCVDRDGSRILRSVLLLLVLLGQHLVFLLHFADLAAQLLNVLALLRDFLLQHRVKLLRVVGIGD